ncbi:MAG: beta-propeller domain-containing protein [Acidobacteriota bacterium]
MRAGLALLVAALCCPPTASSCDSLADVAPGVLDESEDLALPVWLREGDGVTDVNDVVTLLKTAVGLQELGIPGTGDGNCVLDLGDIAPGRLDDTTDPPTWIATGDGRIDIGDIVAALRVSVGLQDLDIRVEEPELGENPSCADVERLVKRMALQNVETYGTWSVHGWWWWDDAALGPFGGVPETDDLDDDGTAIGRTRDHSETNTQVEGIDEPDLVETDGEIIWHLAKNELRAIDAWPPESATLLSATEIVGQPIGLLLHGDLLVVVTSEWDALEPVTPEGTIALGERSTLSFYTTDPLGPQLQRRLSIDGHLRITRRVDDELRMVVLHGLVGPPLPPWEGDLEEYRRAQRRVIRNSTLADWMPGYSDEHPVDGRWERQRGFLLECEDLWLPERPDGAGLSSVVSLDLGSLEPPRTTGIFSQVGTAHASHDRLYLTTTAWSSGEWWGPPPGPAMTRIHVFETPTGLDPSYVAMGEVEGIPPSRYSIQEHENRLRLAVQRGGWWDEQESHGAVLVLEQQGRELVEVGSVDGLGPGETVRSVRFREEIGWVVTFQQVDPLYAVDLVDPTDPRVVGELEVTGFSTYLHPVGDDHLLGIGQEIEPDTLQVLGMQVSLFDVSTVGEPRLQDRLVIDSVSEAQWEPHAFNYHAPVGTLAIPRVTYWEINGLGEVERAAQTGIAAIEVDLFDGLQPLGTLLTPQLSDHQDYDYGCHLARRSVFIEDYLYAVGQSGVSVSQLDDVITPIRQWRGDCDE